jgi:phage/plasmid primase-like uncharacterized protein
MDTAPYFKQVCEQLESIGADTEGVALTGRGTWKRLNNASGRRNNSHISYWLDQDGLGLFGYAVNHHSGEELPLLAQRDWRGFSGDARDAVKRQVEAAKKAHREQLEVARKSAAQHAEVVIARCAEVSDIIAFDDFEWYEPHVRNQCVGDKLGAVGGYVIQKGIIPYGAKYWAGGEIDGVHYREMLVIPRIIDGALAGFQRIITRKDGGFAKLYQDDSAGKAAYMRIGTPNPEKRTIICEGWATGCSIHEATGDFVLVAFDCGNLLSVAEHYRAKEQHKEIIIAADSDQWRFKYNKIPDVVDSDGVITKVVAADIAGDDPRWEQWRQEGRLENIGLNKAREAAVVARAYLIDAGFTDRDAAKKSDFNDLHLALGKEAVAARINEARQVAEVSSVEKKSVVSKRGDSLDTNQLMIPMTEWRNYLKVKEDGEVVKSSVKNQILVIASSDELRGAFRYDPFFNAVMVTRDITGGNDENFRIRRFDDSQDVTTIQLVLE